MTKLETALLAQIREKLAGLDRAAADKLSALRPVLSRIAERYSALGSTAKKTVEEFFPELAELLRLAEEQLG